MNLVMTQMGRTGVVTGGAEENQAAALSTGSGTQPVGERCSKQVDIQRGAGAGRVKIYMRSNPSSATHQLCHPGQDIKHHGAITSDL